MIAQKFAELIKRNEHCINLLDCELMTLNFPVTQIIYIAYELVKSSGSGKAFA